MPQSSSQNVQCFTLICPKGVLKMFKTLPLKYPTFAIKISHLPTMNIKRLTIKRSKWDCLDCSKKVPTKGVSKVCTIFHKNVQYCLLKYPSVTCKRSKSWLTFFQKVAPETSKSSTQKYGKVSQASPTHISINAGIMKTSN